MKKYTDERLYFAFILGIVIMAVISCILQVTIDNQEIEKLGNMICPEGTTYDKIETHHAQNGILEQVLCKNVKPNPIIPEYDGTKIVVN